MKKGVKIFGQNREILAIVSCQGQNAQISEAALFLSLFSDWLTELRDWITWQPVHKGTFWQVFVRSWSLDIEHLLLTINFSFRLGTVHKLCRLKIGDFLGRITEIQIFTTSCWIFKIIQLSFFIRDAFSFQKGIFCSLSKFWKYIGGLRTYFILIAFDEYIMIWYCDVMVKIRTPKFSGKNVYGQKIVKTHPFSPNPGVSRSFEKEKRKKVTAFFRERLFRLFHFMLPAAAASAVFLNASRTSVQF